MAEPTPENQPQSTASANSASTPVAPAPRSGLLMLVRRSVPTAVVLLLLCLLGYWGHRTQWTLPSFSELAGNTPSEQETWCTEHAVPSAICVACNAKLMPKGELFGWCRTHGIAECVLEHPQLAQRSPNPPPTDEDQQRAAAALQLKPRRANDPLCKLHLRRIQFASTAAADKAGIDIGLVERGPITEVIEANAETNYDPTRMARLSARAPGIAWSVEKNVGDEVQQGEVLALIDAAAIGQAKAELLQSLAQVELHQATLQRLATVADGVVAGRRTQETEVALTEAEAAVQRAAQLLANLGLEIPLDDLRRLSAEQRAQRLRYMGLPPDWQTQLQTQQATANLIPVPAARGGVVVARDVVAGEVIDTSRVLFTIVDTSRLWLLLDVPVEDIRFVELGQQVRFMPDGEPTSWEGTVTWISTEVAAETRTVKVRAELANDDGRLRSESFGKANIILREDPQAILIPSDAVHWEGCCHVAFVRDRNYLKEDSYKVFHTRMIRPGVTSGPYTEVIAGLFPGEVVVTKGSGVLRAELLKGNLGAG